MREHIVIIKKQDYMELFDTYKNITGARHNYIEPFGINTWIATDDEYDNYLIDFKGRILSNYNIYHIHTPNILGIGYVKTRDSYAYLVDAHFNQIGKRYNDITEYNYCNLWIATIKNKKCLINETGEIVSKMYQNISPVKNNQAIFIDEHGNVERYDNKFHKIQPELVFVNDDLLSITNKTIKELEAKIVGQNEAIETIVSNLYANEVIIRKNNSSLIKNHKVAILLIGGTGTGKTDIISEVSKSYSKPLVLTNITAYSATGYVGASLTDILVQLMQKANGNLAKAELGVVCLDEFDKLGGYSKSDELSMKKAVQQELLPFISGSKIQIKYNDNFYMFDTSKLTFIAMGAFDKLKTSKNNTTIGFNQTSETNKQERYNTKDFLEYGLEREIIGRFTLVAYTKDYNIEDYQNILLNSAQSPLKSFIEFCNNFDINVYYDESFISESARKAYELNLGARGLQNIFAEIKNKYLLAIINQNVQEIFLNASDILEKEENVAVLSLHK